MIVAGLLNMFARFDRPVRCRDGHLFTTIWIPLASLKALRLGRRRFQHCPAGHHWTMVTPLDRASAVPADLETAAVLHDIRIP
jgi:hypothetical protein